LQVLDQIAKCLYIYLIGIHQVPKKRKAPNVRNNK
jgi:hypothetical protein